MFILIKWIYEMILFYLKYNDKNEYIMFLCFLIANNLWIGGLVFLLNVKMKLFLN